MTVREHLSFQKKVWSESAAAEENISLCHFSFFLSENHIYMSNDDERQH